MEPGTGQQSDLEMKRELQAAVAARRELGPDLEDPILESFLARIGQRIDAQVAEQVGSRGAVPVRTSGRSGSYEGAAVVVGSLILAVPLLAIAGNVAQGWGVAAVMLVIGFINLMYFTVGRQ